MTTTETNLSEMQKKKGNRLEKEETIYIYESCFMAEKKLLRQSVEHRSFSSTYSYSLHNPTMNCSGVTNLAWPLFTLDEFHIKLDGAHGHAQWS
jgi:hypothetical protein